MTSPTSYTGVYGSPFAYQDLTNIQRSVYEVRYPQYNILNVIPVTQDAQPYDMFYQWELQDYTGSAKIISDFADDLPTVDTVAAINVKPIQTLGDCYYWSHLEWEAANAPNNRRPLRDSKAIAARRAIDQLMNQLALYGDEAYNMTGLVNDPSIPVVAAAATGTGGSTRWSTKTAEQILTDLNNLIQSIITNSRNVERPRRILISNRAYGILQNKLTTAVGGVSTLAFFLSSNPEIESIIPIWELDGAGPGGTDLAIAYDPDPRKVSIEAPELFRQLEPQTRNLTTYVLCYARFAGFTAHYPASIAILQGI